MSIGGVERCEMILSRSPQSPTFCHVPVMVMVCAFDFDYIWVNDTQASYSCRIST